jgi:hypothetical protein
MIEIQRVTLPESRRTIFLSKMTCNTAKRKYDLKTHCSDKTQPKIAQFYFLIQSKHAHFYFNLTDQCTLLLSDNHYRKTQKRV